MKKSIGLLTGLLLLVSCAKPAGNAARANVRLTNRYLDGSMVTYPVSVAPSPAAVDFSAPSFPGGRLVCGDGIESVLEVSDFGCISADEIYQGADQGCGAHLGIADLNLDGECSSTIADQNSGDEDPPDQESGIDGHTFRSGCAGPVLASGICPNPFPLSVEISIRLQSENICPSRTCPISAPLIVQTDITGHFRSKLQAGVYVLAPYQVGSSSFVPQLVKVTKGRFSNVTILAGGNLELSPR